MSSWKCDQNIAEYYTEPSSPARIFDGRINWGEKTMTETPPDKSCLQKEITLVPRTSQRWENWQSPPDYSENPPPGQPTSISPMNSVKWKSTPASPNPRANPGSSNTSIPSYPRSIVNMGSSKFTWPRQRAWWGLDQEGELLKQTRTLQ